MKASLLTAGVLACTLASLASAHPVTGDRKPMTPSADKVSSKQDPRLEQALALKRKLTAAQPAPQQGSGPLATAGMNTPGTISLVASGSDVCGTPTPISGGGAVAFDTSLQTTGVEGQANANCLFFGTDDIQNDAWFAWTSGFTGNAILSACGTASNDTKMAVYNGSGCPGAAAIACNDDFCGLQSQLAFPATSAVVYTLQIGKYPGSTDGAGTFSVTPAPPAPGNDLCAAATAVSGAGPHAWTNVGALQDGPTNCGLFTGDVWFNWTAGPTGSYRASTCGQTGFDTMLSVYDTAACQGALLGCNDQFCGNESRVSFAATLGNVYKIQVGGWNGQSGSGTFDVTLAPPPPGNDLCTAATPISGIGPHAFTNVSALTDGPSNCGVMTNDVWFNWTAGVAGPYEVNMCGMATPYDSVLSVYTGAGCPVGAALDCDDDFCFFIGPSKVVFTATAGGVYKIQVGGYNGAEGSGTFVVQPPPPPPANDTCAAFVAISGAGPHSFDTTTATTGAEGQGEGPCLFFGSTAIENDVWYKWTAGSSGQASLSTCAQSSVDTKVGIYPGTPACPVSGSVLACNDDACGLQSTVCWTVTSGATYTIQMGTFPGATGGSGTFGITVGSGSSSCQADDGSSEDALGWTAGGTMAWVQRFGGAGTTNVSSVQITWGTPAFPGGTPGDGSPVTVLLYDDPNDDGIPNDLVLVQQVNTVAAQTDTDAFNTIAFTPVTMNGIFFAGGAQTHTSGQFVAPMDTDSCHPDDRSYFFGDNTANPVNFTNPQLNPFPPDSMAANGFACNLLVRAGCTSSPMIGECFPGTGGVINCPCPSQTPANPSGGCENHGAGSTTGAVMSGSGVADVSSDSLSLTVSNLRVNSTLNVFFSYKPGTTTPTSGIVSGAGVRCIGTGGSLKRLYTVTVSGGTVSKPGMGDLSVSAQSATFPGHAIAAPETRHYFAVYRDGQASLPANCNGPITTNLTNMGRVLWVP